MRYPRKITAYRVSDASYYFHAGEGRRRGLQAAARSQSLGREHHSQPSSIDAHAVRVGRSPRADLEHCRSPIGSQRLRSQ